MYQNKRGTVNTRLVEPLSLIKAFSKNLVKILLVILLVTVIGAVSVQATSAQDDMGMGIGDAGDIQSDGFHIRIQKGEVEGTGYLDEEDSEDWYTLYVGFHKVVSIVMTPPEGSDYDLKVTQPHSDFWGASENEGSVAESIETRTVGGMLGWEYDHFYINVIRKTGAGNYSLSIIVMETIIQDDMGSGDDAGNEISGATEVEPGTGNGFGWSGDRYDFYKIPVIEGQRVDVELVSNLAYYYLGMYDHNQLLVDGESFKLSDGIPAIVSWNATAPGFFYIEVRLMQSQGSYSLNITGMPVNEPPLAWFESYFINTTFIVDAGESIDWDGEIIEYRLYVDGESAGPPTLFFAWMWDDFPSGVYNISLIVVDDQGISSELFTREVVVEEPVPNRRPVAYFDCWIEEGTLYVDALNSSDPDGTVEVYYWYVDGEMIDDAEDWEAWTWEGISEGGYEITLIVVDGQGGESDPYIKDIEHETDLPPEATFTWEIQGNSLIVDASNCIDPDGEISSYVWYVDGVIDDSLEGLATWTWSDIPSGEYVISLKIYDDDGNEASSRATVEMPRFEISGYPIYSVMIGLLLGALILNRAPACCSYVESYVTSFHHITT